MLFRQKAAVKQNVAVHDQSDSKSDFFIRLNRLVVLPNEPSNCNILNLDENSFPVNTERQGKSHAVCDGVHEIEDLGVDGNGGNTVDAAIFGDFENLG